MQKINALSGKPLVFRNQDEISDFIIGEWVNIGKKALSEKGFFSVALSGGKTPLKIYRKIGKSKKIRFWRKTRIFLTDERLVPLDNTDSNYRMIKNNLINYTDIPQGFVHFVNSANKADIAAAQYEQQIKKALIFKNKKLPKFDLIMLGVGKDGHIASLFPGDKALKEKKRLVAVASAPGLKNKRLSITFPVINAARNIIFLVTGKKKAEIMFKVLKEKARLPVNMVRPKQARVFYILDKGAAGG
jgi:6-phosphogluconolactonase